MTSLLVLGFVAGLRHALDADHLAAMASLSRTGGLRASVARGVAWGVGHSVALLSFGGLCLALGQVAHEGWSRMFEGAVGVLLIVLGGDVLRRVLQRRMHAHVHEHGDGAEHEHAHLHAPHGAAAHDHAHGFSVRAFAVGSLHGLAGSGALVMLVVGTTSSVAAGLAWMALFGLGSIAGMAAMSALMTVPLRLRTPSAAGKQGANSGGDKEPAAVSRCATA